MTKKAVIITLGCRLNHADTALLTRRLQRAGFELVPQNFAGEPDLVLLNSCAVTAEAVRKSRQTLRHYRKRYPNACIVVCGCASQVSADEMKNEGASIVFGNNGKKQLEEFLDNLSTIEDNSYNAVFSENATSSFPFRSRAFIKIQEGCNNFCTYCIVPHVRGRERSRSFDEALADCRQAVEAGFPEIILTGVNTCAYNDNGRTLGNLIKAVADIPGDFRIRLSSTEPDFKNIGVLDVIADTPKVCRFLHISLQHGSDRILQAMNRHYSADDFARFADLAREKIPGIHIGTDVIAGFPGETDEDFTECLAFTEKMQFANTHIFTYSRRPGTPAADYPNQVPSQISSERAAALRKVAEKSAKNFATSQIGKTLDVIFEQCRNGKLTGWSDNYLGIVVPEGSFQAGSIVKVKADTSNLAILNSIETEQI